MNQDLKRRTPSQARARKTRLLILETAARILEEHGLAGFNTNRLAELSGFAVGTIYQYFDNKQAIIDALAKHERDKMLDEIQQLLMRRGTKAADSGPLQRERTIVRALLHAFGGRQRTRRILLNVVTQEGGARRQSTATVLAGLLASGLVSGKAGTAFVLSETDAFVLTQALAG